jgi:hypothetical protein
VLAAVIFYWNPPLIGYTEKGNLILELFSFTHTLSLLAVGCIWYPLCRRNPVLRFPFAAFLLLAAFYLMLFQYFRPTYDFRCWMNGMESHLELGHPYQTAEKPNYWYPPLMAQTLAVTYEILDFFFGKYTRHIKALVFYFYQCHQFAMLVLAFWLTYFFARDLKLPRRAASVAAFLLLLFNVPLIRLLYFQQPNLWLVCTILAVLLLRDRSPVWAGFALALGFHVKLYPAILGLPLLLTGKWRVIFWSAFFALLIFLLEIKGTHLDLWANFMEQISQPRWGSYFRDNSVHGIAKNMLKPFGMAERYDRPATILLQALAVIWMMTRIIRREISVRRLLSSPESNSCWIRDAWFNEQTMDTLSMSFFLSPIVFEHHYTMTIPIMLWTFAVWGNNAPRRVFWGCILILLVPIYDVAILAWNRIAGLILLIFARRVKLKEQHPAWPPKMIQAILSSE